MVKARKPFIDMWNRSTLIWTAWGSNVDRKVVWLNMVKYGNLKTKNQNQYTRKLGQNSPNFVQTLLYTQGMFKAQFETLGAHFIMDRAGI